MRIDGYAYDLEMLVRAQRAGFNQRDCRWSWDRALPQAPVRGGMLWQMARDTLRLLVVDAQRADTAGRRLRRSPRPSGLRLARLLTSSRARPAASPAMVRIQPRFSTAVLPNCRVTVDWSEPRS